METFLDSLHDPDFCFPTLDEYKTQQALTGFDMDKHQTLGNGLTLLQAWRRS